MFQLLPSPAELTAPAAALAAFFAATLVLLGAWVYYDAASRGAAHPGRWAVAVALVAPLLLAYVHRRGDRVRGPTRGEEVTLPALLACLFAWITGTLLAPPDPYTQVEYVYGVLVVALPAAYMFVSPGEKQSAESAG